MVDGSPQKLTHDPSTHRRRDHGKGTQSTLQVQRIWIRQPLLPVFDEPVAYSEETFDKAVKHCQGMQANMGGTEMRSVVSDVLDKLPKATASCSF